jgi:hypothetical protein
VAVRGIEVCSLGRMRKEEGRHLEAEAGLTPMPPLGVVPRRKRLIFRVLFAHCLVHFEGPGRFLLPLQPQESSSSGCSYLMVLPVRSRIHWGMGRFCFWALASFCLILKVLWLC